MITLSKYHGCGNDFLLLEAIGEHTDRKKAIVRALCDRHTGIGADGCIFVHREPLAMEIYNCDGSIASMCGNGLRCFAKYVLDEGICTKRSYTVNTLAGDMRVKLDSISPFLVSVRFPKPILDQKDAGSLPKRRIWHEPVRIDGRRFYIDTCFVGNVHTILYVEDITDVSLADIGKKLHVHPLFPEQTNVNFVRVVDASRIQVKTYERGVGMSLACGSGCCAAAWDAYMREYVQRDVLVELPRGSLRIRVHEDETITMQGSAKRIMKGTAEGI